MNMTTINTDKVDNHTAIIAFKVDNLSGWQEQVMLAAVKTGCKATRKGAGCLIWNPKQLIAVNDSLKYVNGFKIVREWMGPAINVLGVIPRRMYFEGDCDMPSSKPEWLLVGDTKPVLQKPSKRIRMCIDFASKIGDNIAGFNPNPVPVSRVRSELHKRTEMVFGNQGKCLAGQKVSVMLMRHGFYSVPKNIKIELVAQDVSQSAVQYYRDLMEDAFRRCKCEIKIQIVSNKKMKERLSKGKADVKTMQKGYCALIAISGKKGQPLTEQTKTLIASMQLAGVPFRMFSIDNKSLKWSALDQAGSLLMGTGGIPYIIQLPWPEKLQPPYLLGVDIGHPKDIRESWVVMSLMDHSGIPVANWSCRQKRDETIGKQQLRAGLRWARKTACEHSGRSDKSFFVIRDGRLHKSETVGMYKKNLGSPITFVELAKYNNPQMFIPGANPRPANAGMECLPADSVTPFFVPVSPRLTNDLARTLKIHMAPPWDGLGLGIDKVTEIVIGLSYTPGLGLATHTLPGPVYWADGIAARNETNHQFTGQRIVTF
jgi:hypothetical protein